MPIDQAAFRPFERVKIVDEERLKFILQQSTTTSPLSIHVIFDPNMHQHAGVCTEILRVETYHMGIPVYVIKGNGFRWPEQAFIDLELDIEALPNDPQSRASKTYVAEILDGHLAIMNRNGECFGRLRKRYVEDAVDAANMVASIRCRHAFETIYGFDGRYDGVPYS